MEVERFWKYDFLGGGDFHPHGLSQDGKGNSLEGLNDYFYVIIQKRVSVIFHENYD